MSLAPYRLVWFQHFHKAAGTSLVRLALANGERPFAGHYNGSLVESDGRRAVPIWRYSRPQLSEFLDRCQRENVTFVATEFGVPDLEFLATDSRVTLVTCLRDPLARFLSNYYFDLHRGYARVSRIEDYAGSKGAYTLRNYYCWMLSRQSEEAHAIDAQDFALAQRQLDLFDHAVIAEDGDSWKRLQSSLGWAGIVPVENRNLFGLRELSGLVKRRRYRAIWHRLRQPVRPPSGDFVARFNAEHSFDVALYRQLLRADIESSA